MKLEINKNEIKNILEMVENCNVDVRSTIEKTISTHFMNDDFFIEILDEGTIADLKHFHDFNLELLSDEFFDFIYSKLDEGIYISLAYANSETAGHDKVYEFDVENVDKEYLEITGISTWKDGADLILNEKDGLFIGDLESDFGIELYQRNGSMSLSFSWRGRKCDGPGCPREIYSIENELDEPLNYLAIKMMYDAIIFEK